MCMSHLTSGTTAAEGITSHIPSPSPIPPKVSSFESADFPPSQQLSRCKSYSLSRSSIKVVSSKPWQNLVDDKCLPLSKSTSSFQVRKALELNDHILGKSTAVNACNGLVLSQCDDGYGKEIEKSTDSSDDSSSSSSDDLGSSFISFELVNDNCSTREKEQRGCYKFGNVAKQSANISSKEKILSTLGEYSPTSSLESSDCSESDSGSDGDVVYVDAVDDGGIDCSADVRNAAMVSKDVVIGHTNMTDTICQGIKFIDQEDSPRSAEIVEIAHSEPASSSIRLGESVASNNTTVMEGTEDEHCPVYIGKSTGDNKSADEEDGESDGTESTVKEVVLRSPDQDDTLSDTSMDEKEDNKLEVAVVENIKSACKDKRQVPPEVDGAQVLDIPTDSDSETSSVHSFQYVSVEMEKHNNGIHLGRVSENKNRQQCASGQAFKSCAVSTNETHPATTKCFDTSSSSYHSKSGASPAISCNSSHSTFPTSSFSTFKLKSKEENSHKILSDENGNKHTNSAKSCVTETAPAVAVLPSLSFMHKCFSPLEFHYSNSNISKNLPEFCRSASVVKPVSSAETNPSTEVNHLQTEMEADCSALKIDSIIHTNSPSLSVSSSNPFEGRSDTHNVSKASEFSNVPDGAFLSSISSTEESPAKDSLSSTSNIPLKLKTSDSSIHSFKFWTSLTANASQSTKSWKRRSSNLANSSSADDGASSFSKPVDKFLVTKSSELNVTNAVVGKSSSLCDNVAHGLVKETKVGVSTTVTSFAASVATPSVIDSSVDIVDKGLSKLSKVDTNISQMLTSSSHMHISNPVQATTTIVTSTKSYASRPRLIWSALRSTKFGLMAGFSKNDRPATNYTNLKSSCKGDDSSSSATNKNGQSEQDSTLRNISPSSPLSNSLMSATSKGICAGGVYSIANSTVKTSVSSSNSCEASCKGPVTSSCTKSFIRPKSSAKEYSRYNPFSAVSSESSSFDSSSAIYPSSLEKDDKHNGFDITIDKLGMESHENHEKSGTYPVTGKNLSGEVASKVSLPKPMPVYVNFPLPKALRNMGEANTPHQNRNMSQTANATDKKSKPHTRSYLDYSIPRPYRTSANDKTLESGNGCERSYYAGNLPHSAPFSGNDSSFTPKLSWTTRDSTINGHHRADVATRHAAKDSTRQGVLLYSDCQKKHDELCYENQEVERLLRNLEGKVPDLDPTDDFQEVRALNQRVFELREESSSAGMFSGVFMLFFCSFRLL